MEDINAKIYNDFDAKDFSGVFITDLYIGGGGLQQQFEWSKIFSIFEKIKILGYC